MPHHCRPLKGRQASQATGVQRCRGVTAVTTSRAPSGRRRCDSRCWPRRAGVAGGAVAPVVLGVVVGWPCATSCRGRSVPTRWRTSCPDVGRAIGSTMPPAIAVRGERNPHRHHLASWLAGPRSQDQSTRSRTAPHRRSDSRSESDMVEATRHLHTPRSKDRLAEPAETCPMVPCVSAS